MSVIHKFVLPVRGHVSIEMPRGAQVLKCDMQRGNLCLWAIVDPSLELVHRYFRVVGTGHAFDDLDAGSFVGTVQETFAGGELVFHVFEARPPLELFPGASAT